MDEVLLDDVLDRARRSRVPEPRLRRALRRGAGVTQADVAAVLGIDQATIARYELGYRTPRGDLAIRYAELLARLAEEATR